MKLFAHCASRKIPKSTKMITLLAGNIRIDSTRALRFSGNKVSDLCMHTFPICQPSFLKALPVKIISDVCVFVLWLNLIFYRQSERAKIHDFWAVCLTVRKRRMLWVINSSLLDEFINKTKCYQSLKRRCFS